MVEILKPNEFKKIFEDINEEWDEMDIMEHLENFADYYEKTTYHFHRTLTRKLDATDPYDPEYGVTQFLEGHGSDIPTIATYKDAPNPALRFAKVYASYMLHVSDILEINGAGDDNDNEEGGPTYKLNSRFNQEELLQLHEFLVLNCRSSKSL